MASPSWGWGTGGEWINFFSDSLHYFIPLIHPDFDAHVILLFRHYFASKIYPAMFPYHSYPIFTCELFVHISVPLPPLAQANLNPPPLPNECHSFYKLMPYTKTRTRPTTEDRMVLLTPATDPALPAGDGDGDGVGSSSVALVCSWILTTVIPPSVHSSPLRGCALDRNVMSAHCHNMSATPKSSPRKEGEKEKRILTLYSALPLSPTVTTWILPCCPSSTFRSAGRSSFGTHRVPLPVVFQNSGVKV